MSIPINENTTLLENLKAQAQNLPKKTDGLEVTATQADVLTGKKFVDSEGRSLDGAMANNGTTLTQTVTKNGDVTIPKGYHEAGKLTVDVPINGSDVSGVTATAADVLSGKKFVDSTGATVNGTMANRGSSLSQTVTTNGDITISKGYHNAGKITVDVPQTVNYDLSDLTVSADDVLSGAYFINSRGSKSYGAIQQQDSSSVTVSDETVTVPSGYYSSKVTRSIDSGSLSEPEISVTSSGTISAVSGVDTAGYLSTTESKSSTYKLDTQSAKIWTPGTSNQTIASGKYLTGAQTIKGDSNLVASNIKSGVSIFGVAGTYEGSTSSDGGSDTGSTTTPTITIKHFIGSSSALSQVSSFLISDIPSDMTQDNIISITLIESGVVNSWGASYVICGYYNPKESTNIVMQWASSTRYLAGISDIEYVKSGSTMNIKSPKLVFDGAYEVYISYAVES